MSGAFTLGAGLPLGQGGSAVHCTAYGNLNIDIGLTSSTLVGNHAP